MGHPRAKFRGREVCSEPQVPAWRGSVPARRAFIIHDATPAGTSPILSRTPSHLLMQRPHLVLSISRYRRTIGIGDRPVFVVALLE